MSEYPRGACWLLQRCNWWNPTLDMICKGGKDYCIKCWKFKKTEEKLKIKKNKTKKKR